MCTLPSWYLTAPWPKTSCLFPGFPSHDTCSQSEEDSAFRLKSLLADTLADAISSRALASVAASSVLILGGLASAEQAGANCWLLLPLLSRSLLDPHFLNREPHSLMTYKAAESTPIPLWPLIPVPSLRPATVASLHFSATNQLRAELGLGSWLIFQQASVSRVFRACSTIIWIVSGEITNCSPNWLARQVSSSKWFVYSSFFTMLPVNKPSIFFYILYSLPLRTWQCNSVTSFT